MLYASLTTTKDHLPFSMCCVRAGHDSTRCSALPGTGARVQCVGLYATRCCHLACPACLLRCAVLQVLDLRNIQVISQVLAQSVAMDFYSRSAPPLVCVRWQVVRTGKG